MLKLKYLSIVLTFITLVCAEINFHESEFCDFFETKNITSGEKFKNGTILFDEVLYPDGYYRTYNYTLQESSNAKVQTKSHIRGCFCKLIICVRICPGSEDYTETIVVSRDNETSEINLNNFGTIHSWPLIDDSKEIRGPLNENLNWNISEVFKLRY
jgi:uncharacterized protein YifE (UPF0438 family)